MSFNRPSLATLIDRIATDIASRLPGTGARLRRAMTTILGRAQAGAVHGLYGHQEWIAKQILVDTCDEDVLARHAAIWKVPRKAPVAANGPIQVAGDEGDVVPAGTSLTRGDGTEYTTDADATIVGGVATANVTATVAGVAGDAVANTALSFVAPIAGINANATVAAAGIGGGADVEDLEAWRARLLTRIQQPPKGGTSSDYLEWALSVSGVTRAWVYPQELGIGTITVRFVTDNAPGGLIPDVPTVTAVQDYIDSVRPVTADVTVVAPTASPLDLTIQLTPDTVAVRDAVTAELADLINREASPGGTILLSHINEAISIAAGETDHVLTVPAANVVEATGAMTTLGVITWA
ncbi:baseplate J/gp47 family protein [Dyella lutea]|uniref:Baseplate J/gp47 family protein n=1 Tax=Dyella lutea TaxID=2950441 RepID=A0ABT1FDG0_9GAMM|nr:baseplate J/gp47 family protein [Dyella lutea]MCP1375400.1 baseplate J/gp47 family protein [Dyella lutea]